MQNETCQKCGGCIFRSLSRETYRQNKEDDFRHTLGLIKQANPLYDDSIFIDDGLRRRADLSFKYSKKQLLLGFNERESHNIINIVNCPMLTDKLNDLLPKLYDFLSEYCAIAITVKNKKKLEKKMITSGSIYLLEADNGIDITMYINEEPNVEHRMLVAEFVNSLSQICRFSWSINQTTPEKIVEKYPPKLYIADYEINVPQGCFLQASKTAQTAMINKVLEYMGNTHGKIADLFCGLGTFTYPLAKIKENEIISVDSYEPSLQGLRQALNQNQIKNVTVINRNLFKYPFDKDDLKEIKALVIDPPRAGAHEQCRVIADLSVENKPQKIVFVSCNPKTFVYDAQLLIAGGYELKQVTLVDQFVYSKHEELIALFTLNPEHQKGE